jgi:hypothetical protein
VAEAHRRADDRGSIDRRVEAIDARALDAPVRSALHDPEARVTALRGERIAYDFLNPSSGAIYRFTGTAAGEHGPGAWSLVLKVTRPPEGLAHDPPLSPELARVLSEAVRWDRELLAYETGFLERLDGLAAPRCHGGVRHDDGTGWLWLEDLGGDASGPWSLDRWAAVGRSLGVFNGSYIAAGRVPDDAWLGRSWLRVWVTRITPFHYARAIAPGPVWEHPLVREQYPTELRQRLSALWANREALLAAVDALPRTCSHLDAHRRNLYVRSEGGLQQVVAIDWGLLGLAAPGEEIASTLVGTVASGELPVEAAPELAEVLYDAYLAGLRDAGWSGRGEDVRFAFAAAAGLRAFSILGLDVVDDPRRTTEETAASLARSAALARLLLQLGEEAQSRRRALGGVRRGN